MWYCCSEGASHDLHWCIIFFCSEGIFIIECGGHGCVVIGMGVDGGRFDGERGEWDGWNRWVKWTRWARWVKWVEWVKWSNWRLYWFPIAAAVVKTVILNRWRNSDCADKGGSGDSLWLYCTVLTARKHNTVCRIFVIAQVMRVFGCMYVYTSCTDKQSLVRKSKEYCRWLLMRIELSFKFNCCCNWIVVTIDCRYNWIEGWWKTIVCAQNKQQTGQSWWWKKKKKASNWWIYAVLCFVLRKNFNIGKRWRSYF